MLAVVFTIAGLVLGSIPFSYIVGKLFLNRDIRDFGDGNPGAANAWKAGGWKVGLLAGFLDYLKGAAPVMVATFAFDITGWQAVPLALAPVVGHAFSPFLKFQGGKAVAVTFGIWTGLTLYEGPLALGISLAVLSLVQEEDSWSTVLAMFALLAYLFVRTAPGYLFAVWGGNLAVIVYRHLGDLKKGIHLKPSVRNALRRAL